MNNTKLHPAGWFGLLGLLGLLGLHNPAYFAFFGFFALFALVVLPVHRDETMRDDSMNRFTPRAQQALALARKEAERLHHNCLGTEHLLLGLIKMRPGVAAIVLQRLGLNLDRPRPRPSSSSSK